MQSALVRQYFVIKSSTFALLTFLLDMRYVKAKDCHKATTRAHYVAFAGRLAMQNYEVEVKQRRLSIQQICLSSEPTPYPLQLLRHAGLGWV